MTTKNEAAKINILFGDPNGVVGHIKLWIWENTVLNSAIHLLDILWQIFPQNL